MVTKIITNELLPIESIRERDIDLILLEELTCNEAFCSWLINESSLPNFDKLIGVWRSISDFGLGETDLLMDYLSTAKKRIFLLIENKMDATFQQDQEKRYGERAKQYVQNGSCDECYTLLVAPENYCSNQNEFKGYLTYEMLSHWFSDLDESRATFKAKLINIGIEKLRRGYQPINSDIVQEFWNCYWELVNNNYRHFNMKKPNVIPHNSDWPILHDKKNKQISFIHKWGQGHADLTIKSTSENLANKIRSILPEGGTLIQHKSSFSIRKVVSIIHRNRPFHEQLNEIQEGLTELSALHSWFIDSPISKDFNN